MVYLDSSVVLAYLLAEDRCPPASLWRENLISSRLLEYEVWNRINAARSAGQRGQDASALLSRIQFVDMTSNVLRRALRPFSISVRTLDSLHLATIEHIRASGDQVILASFDDRMLRAAHALEVPLYQF